MQLVHMSHHTVSYYVIFASEYKKQQESQSKFLHSESALFAACLQAGTKP